MDFLTTARMLMDMQAKCPGMSYHFDDLGNLVVTVPVDEGVAQDFQLGLRLFEFV